jgi:hypothetical protein
MPALVDRVEHVGGLAGPDPVPLEVVVKAERVTVPDAQRCGRFEGIGESMEVVERDAVTVARDESQCAAGLDRTELCGVAKEPDAQCPRSRSSWRVPARPASSTRTTSPGRSR